ncbi:DUF1223 domain-containing protein [Pedobacter jamesrossensis]|uniref:DUF1223 domain-containing protein n=1 Tax=Pedobacter jamesrossensis TaxID=1908238 RepID=A0ABV8NQ23_9SPHI
MIAKTTLAIILLASISMAFSIKPINKHLSIDSGFAVVELFTSEGCSSCPPADALVAKIEKENYNKSVYILAYHVDYWDRLGWKDSFSNPKFSARQNQYANWLNLQSVYTPQIIVNGTKEFVGSEESTLRKAISTALSANTASSIQMKLTKQEGNFLTLSYAVNQATENDDLVIALINTNAISKILKGENKGKTLSHVQIVNQFETFSLNGKKNGSVEITSQKLKNSQAIQIIAFLQNKKTGKISSATKIEKAMTNS